MSGLNSYLIENTNGSASSLKKQMFNH